MRVSIDRRDRGFRHGLDVSTVRVYLDGVLRRDAVTADEELGEVVVYVRGTDGTVVTDEDGRSARVRTLRGRVRVDVLAVDGFDHRTERVDVVQAWPGAIEVLVYSRVSPRNVRRHTIDAATVSATGADRLVALCGALAGAGAEHVCATYGDAIDPSEAARLGSRLCAELLARRDEGTRH